MAKFFLWSCKEGNMYVVCLCIVSSYFSTIATILNISSVFPLATYVGLSWDNALTDNLPCHFYFWHCHSYWIFMYTYAQKHRCEFQSLWHFRHLEFFRQNQELLPWEYSPRSNGGRYRGFFRASQLIPQEP